MKMILERRSAVLLTIILLVNALALLPLLTTGYFFDDIFDSQIRGIMIQMHSSLWQITYHFATIWLKSEGRLFPMEFVSYSIFYLLGKSLLYKTFVLCVILANITVFFWFLRRLAGSNLVPAIATLLLPLLFQFRASSDPILAHAGSYAVINLLLFASLGLFLRSIDRSSRLSVWIAAAMFLYSCLIFEVGYPMSLAYGVVAYFRLNSLKAAVRASWPFFAVTFCLTLASAILRARATAPSGLYKMSLNILVVIKTYFVQMFGAVPFSYVLFDPHGVFASWPNTYPISLWQGLLLGLVLAAIMVSAASWILSSDSNDHKPNNFRSILAVGILFVAGPPFLISLSPRYQPQTWGDAYLPVYITYFGVATLLALALETLFRRPASLKLLGRWVHPVLICLWIFLFGINYRDNWLVAQSLNESLWNPRVLLESALDHGLLKGLSPHSVLLVKGTDFWDNADEYSSRTGIRFAVYRMSEPGNLVPVFQQAGGTCESALAQQVCDFPTDSPVYTVQIRHLTNGTGSVLLARVRRAYQSSGSILGLSSYEAVGYFRIPLSGVPLAVAISGQDLRGKIARTTFRSGNRELRVLNSGRDWQTVSLHRNTEFDALSLRGEISSNGDNSTMSIAKTKDALQLHGSGPELLHAGYEKGDIGGGVVLSPVSFTDDMSVEFLVDPADLQTPYSEIVSNHATDFRGLAIEQVSTQTNRYSVVFGSGKAWMDAGVFNLLKNKRNYVSLQVKAGQVTVYVDGTLVCHRVLPEPIASSSRPVRIGNWLGGNRPFSGWIEEVLVAQGAKSQEAVRADATRLAVTPNPGGPANPLLLIGTESSIVHLTFSDEHSQSQVLPNTSPLPDTFTLELLVRAAASQSPYATIVSNHPGKNGYQGFTLEQIATKTNSYALSFGNGKTWMNVATLLLSNGDLHYLAIAKKNHHVTVYLDGVSVGDKVLEVEPALSEFPLMLGDWTPKGRAFNGTIQEVRITRTLASGKAIAQQENGLLANQGAFFREGH